MESVYDHAVIGAGIAGASLAAGLVANGSVLLLEAEDQPGYHSTGRSAAFWAESYGGPLIQPLTTASGPFLSDHGFLSPRGALTLARAEEKSALDAFVATFSALGVRVDPLDREQLESWLPGLAEPWRHGAYEPDCTDIDVAGLHQLWLGAARRGGANVATRARLAAARYEGGLWRIETADGRGFAARVLVNAAGAWADEVAAACGVRPIGIQPMRRTVAQLRVGVPVRADLPLTLGIDGLFYFKPENGRLWLSPHDETPTPPCDAAPEDLDVAVAIDRFEGVVDWPVLAVERKWAGLRSFAPDRLPVYGFAPDSPAFFWFAGQGGFGIQTAPAAADLALRLLRGEAPGAVDPEPYRPGRFT
ncbi:D-arginine dehydrogenase [Novosphingobium kunmingense]|uniref:D-arginine dehydrogenase n=1 Tax=Novosphingobium kunmingense TaxID=1211806 RepID=A0A2N0HKN3_9SPHN|nr:FAD-binding oxidoreductase [Novosphingobium kunmingense]PKB19517.1 D-arginine dehydrogenase [Novosphingobium kunmingense]